MNLADYIIIVAVIVSMVITVKRLGKNKGTHSGKCDGCSGCTKTSPRKNDR